MDLHEKVIESVHVLAFCFRIIGHETETDSVAGRPGIVINFCGFSVEFFFPCVQAHV